jgi:hypothetical protein
LTKMVMCQDQDDAQAGRKMHELYTSCMPIRNEHTVESRRLKERKTEQWNGVTTAIALMGGRYHE